MEQKEVKRLERIAKELRIQVVRMMETAGSGHAGGSMSIAEMIAVLYFHEMKIDAADPSNPDRDRFVLSKGHSCFTLYAALAKLGIIPEEQLDHPYEVDSMIQGHPEFGITPGIDMGTGALGQGLSIGIGMALAARIKKKNYRVYVVIGDGECMEGMIWEAAMLAPKRGIDNLVAILDYNKMCLTSPIQEVISLEPIADKWKAFGWHVLEVNGHSISELYEALIEAKSTKGKPTFIVAHTIKGKGMPAIENTAASHAFGTFTSEMAEEIVRHLNAEGA